MPISAVVRRMRGQWSLVTSRSEAYAAGIAAEGVSRAVFARDVLSDVDPSFTDEILRLLHRRGVVWVRWNRGACRVYGSRPQTIEVEQRHPASTMLAAVAPHVHDVALALDRNDREGARVAAGRAARLALKHGVEHGLTLIRDALWRTFPEPVMRSVAFEAPRLQRESRVEAVELPPAKPKRLPSGLGIEEKVYRRIEKAGAEGMTRTDLIKRVRPKMTFAELDEITGQLEAAGMIVSGTMRLAMRGRPGTRMFAASIGLPHVNSKGVAVLPK